MVLTLFKPSLSVIFFEIGGVLMSVKFIIVQHNVAVPKIEAVHHLMVRCNYLDWNRQMYKDSFIGFKHIYIIYVLNIPELTGRSRPTREKKGQTKLSAILKKCQVLVAPNELRQRFKALKCGKPQFMDV